MYKCENVEYQVGDKFASITEYGTACIYEILFVAPTIEYNDERVVFVKEIRIALDSEGNEDKTEHRSITYNSYYDWVVVFGDPINGNEVYGLKF